MSQVYTIDNLQQSQDQLNNVVLFNKSHKYFYNVFKDIKHSLLTVKNFLHVMK